MTNKLSELSKPVAQAYYDEHDSSAMLIDWIVDSVPEAPAALYSQEYVSALLAELESKSAYAADWCHSAKKRKDLLEDANKRIAELEAKLATPVRLPRPACTYADHSYPAYSRKQVEEIITSAGMRFTVEGDDQ
ncbi:hypothetical protein [Serratia ureilytica]|uniref:hypothetical protein n=1 Tax=Serratia ureilytica TaxID=300181 RepID=UPI00191FE166|nr:hypothetical protein [Serratia ureilytica]